MKALSALILLFLISAAPAEPRVIHVFVALCDNASQGIAKVPAKIGNGDDPDNNLYWGCTDGVRSVFKRSPAWKQVAAVKAKDDADPVLERLIFRHAKLDAWLIADAYRGREIKRCMEDYFAALGGHFVSEATAGETTVKAGGAANLVAYIGHDGLMEFDFAVKPPVEKMEPKQAIAFCCISQTYFSAKLTALNAQPLLLTTQLMYPGGFLLEASAEGWLAGEPAEACRQRAARAYAGNQKISVKAAAGIFTTALAPEKKPEAGANGQASEE